MMIISVSGQPDRMFHPPLNLFATREETRRTKRVPNPRKAPLGPARDKAGSE